MLTRCPTHQVKICSPASIYPFLPEETAFTPRASANCLATEGFSAIYKFFFLNSVFVIKAVSMGKLFNYLRRISFTNFTSFQSFPVTAKVKSVFGGKDCKDSHRSYFPELKSVFAENDKSFLNDRWILPPQWVKGSPLH